MFDLTRQEKIILVFLSALFIIGLGARFYKKSHEKIDINLRPYGNDLALNASEDFSKQTKKVNVNSFDIEELKHLPGVGETLAERIIQYHRVNGSFQTAEDLMRVEGIGEKKLERLKDLIIFK